MKALKKEKTKKVKEEDSPKVQSIKFNILAVVCIILFCVTLAPVTLQNDTFYTIRIGEHILQTKTVDMQEPFSWHQGLPYTYPHWLYDVMIYLFFYIGGMKGIFISTVAFSAILGVVVYFTNKKISKNSLMSFLITLGTMFLIKDFIAARAQLVSFILLELIVLLIEEFLEKKKKRYAIGIILIAILIANIHAAIWPFIFILFLPYIGEYILSFDYIGIYFKIVEKSYNKRLKKYEKKEKNEKIDTKISKLKIKISDLIHKKNEVIEKSKNRRKNPYKLRMVKEPAAKWLILLMVILVFTGLLTPIGDTPYTWTYNTMRGNTTQHINEHQPLTLIDNKAMLVVLAFVLAILIFTDVKIRLRDLFFVGGLFILMLMSRRQESMFLLFGSGVLARLISEIVEKYDKEGTKEFIKLMTSTLGTIATVLAIALLMIMQIKGKTKDKFIDAKAYPVDAAAYIKENIDLSAMRLYNEYNYGSYLLYEGIPVFIDSRADLYTPEFNKTEEYPDGRDIFSDYIRTSNVLRYYEDTFEKYDITHIILYKRAKLTMLLEKDTSGKYNRIYADDNFVIYERNKV